MFNIGPGELIAISMVALLVLGPQRLPGAVRTVGRVVGELRRISGGFQDELRNAFDQSQLDDDAPTTGRHRPPPEPPDLPDGPGAAHVPEALEVDAGPGSDTGSDRRTPAVVPEDSSEAGDGAEPTATGAAEAAGADPGEDHEGASTTDSAEKADGPDRADTETPRASGTTPADS
jgi:sec-independent protein translocase protein TatB